MSNPSQTKESTVPKKKKKKRSINWRQILIVGGLLIALFSMVAPDISRLFSSAGSNRTTYTSASSSNSTSNPAPVKNAEPMPEPKFQKEGELYFQKAGGGKAFSKIEIEKADTEVDRQFGLMFRKSMPEDQGMLFLFEASEQQSFWMRNTYIPLDIMFVDENGVITTIHENAKPQNDTSLPSNGPAKYVVEVNGGYAKKYGIEVGDKISWQ
ncbi:MAG: DUF192 domain-containing protein [Saprospiraceae bacterium]|nr:DUF192 domain-containing protein [Saprospiraceae bacterium]MCF8251099.1 DUF192 domain-containing protein [Saprospiraceae bacterium]MCF8281001.1 DUF192 domain-containing protein [Bacteroidales bacterium]MCF8312943.1 DUF192 domain-containing protein [Saprospiraceae bacterium]MCF8441358.1 DUF192 domain-containing protein [Saprospiraceae bacterium]